MSIGIDNITFKPASIIYSRIKRRLKSFDAANTIDDGEFPEYTKDVLRRLGLGVYKESEAMVEIKNGRGCLPDDFRSLYACYKCSPNFLTVYDKQPTKHIQPGSFSFKIDIIDEIELTDQFGLPLPESFKKSLNMTETITLKQYVEDSDSKSFSNFIPLRLSPNVSPDCCADDCMNKLCSSPYEITIKDKTIYTNFTDDFVFMKYYSFPLDENNDILVPDVEQIEKAIEWYIIYQVLLYSWFDSSIPDIQNKWQVAEQQYAMSFMEAKNWLKTPSFASMLNIIRNTRSQNKLRFFTQQYSNTNFQRS